MLRPIYSVRFMAHSGVVSPVTYTVPVGYRAVLRDIDVYSGGSLTQFAWYFEGSALQTIWAYQEDSVNADWRAWRGRQVFYAGEMMLFRSDQPVDVTASGYLLIETS